MAEPVKRNVRFARAGERVVRVPREGVMLDAAGDLFVDGEHVATRVRWSDEWGMWFATLVPPFDPHTVNEERRSIAAVVECVQRHRADPAYQPNAKAVLV